MEEDSNVYGDPVPWVADEHSEQEFTVLFSIGKIHHPERHEELETTCAFSRKQVSVCVAGFGDLRFYVSYSIMHHLSTVSDRGGDRSWHWLARHPVQLLVGTAFCVCSVPTVGIRRILFRHCAQAPHITVGFVWYFVLSKLGKEDQRNKCSFLWTFFQIGNLIRDPLTQIIFHLFNLRLCSIL